MIFDTNTIFALIISYRYFLILPIAIVEGPIVTVIAAFLASQGYFNIFLVYIIVVLGDIIGDFIYYGIGKFGNNKLIYRLLSLLKVGSDKIETSKAYFKDSPGKTLLFGKFTHSAGFIILIAAGVADVSVKDFLWYNLVGTIPKSLLFLLIGYFAGSAYKQIDSYIGKVSLLLLIFVVGFVLFKYVFKKIKSYE